MAELNLNNNKKVIAFYLPQYHTIPENDRWWGKGFTEWTNTKKAKPLFDGHYQPRTPLNENYYNLADVTVMERQAEMAKNNGVYGFCYYHYWFKNGKKLLEKPVENMLADPKVDIPFCMCWANENWSRNWDGGNREIIMEQDYGNEKEWKKHFEYLKLFFEDDRYIKVSNKPIIVIYKPEQIQKFGAMIDLWEQLAIEAGFSGLIVVRQFPNSLYNREVDDSHIDYSIKFEPAASQAYEYFVKNKFNKTSQKRVDIKEILSNTCLHTLKKKIEKKGNAKPIIEDYDKAWQIILKEEPYDKKIINGAFVDWDNTARNINGRLYKGATPEKFKKYLSELAEKDSALDLIFINAWNEWAEGAYLEPDEKNGYAYLDAVKSVFNAKRN